MCEEGVVALDREDRLPRLDPVAVVERTHDEVVPAVRAELEDRDRLVHTAEQGPVLLEHLHEHPRTQTGGEQRRPRVVEVGIGVVAVPHLLDRELEHLRVETLPPEDDRHLSSARQASRAASATSTWSADGSAVEKRRWSSNPGRARAFQR